MQVKFTISPTLNSEGGVQSVRTPMLMLTKIQGMGLGAGPKAIDSICDGLLSQALEENGFKADLAEAVTVEVGPDCAQENLVMMGLGSVQNFTPCGLAEVIDRAIDETLKKGCGKLTIPVVANRLTALNINLMGTAHIVRRTAEHKLGPIESDVCTSQAKRHIQKGLDVVCKHRKDRCCKGDKD
jgi:Cytosol aminopeptidase family, N-terminal domain